MTAVSFVLDPIVTPLTDVAVWIALGAAGVLVVSILGVLILWPFLRAARDGDDGLRYAERKAMEQRAKWRAEGADIVLSQKDRRP
jgi:hypothetical protein